VEPLLGPVTEKVPYLPKDTEQLVRINAGIQVGAGTLLAMGRLPRLSALALAVSLVPTTLAGHRFWEAQGPERQQHQRHFLKNVGLCGGLLIAAVDTEGRPSLAWRARHVGASTKHAVRATRREARLAAKAARGEAKAATRAARAKLPV
jgi:hypothetical protein